MHPSAAPIFVSQRQQQATCSFKPLRFHTIMAYYCSYNAEQGYTGGFVPALNHFSNPDVSYLGQPTGTATANNARTVRENMVRFLPMHSTEASTIHFLTRARRCLSRRLKTKPQLAAGVRRKKQHAPEASPGAHVLVASNYGFVSVGRPTGGICC